VEAVVDESLRGDTMRNHTGTHILHAALRKVLGNHVRQAGSLVTPDRLRFDFTHLEALTPAQVREVEALANRVVRENLSVNVDYKSYEEALADGALAFFGDKYADIVRVVGVCDVELRDCFSHELCGGTHVHASGEVGSIVITGETSIGAGLRRIEAVTGRAAAERTRAHEETLSRVGASLLVPAGEIEARLAAIRDENDRLRKQVQTLERRLARGEAAEVAANATQVGGVSVVVTNVPDAPSADALRDMGDGLRQKLGESIVLLGSVIEGKPVFLAMATPDAAKRCPAGDVVRAAAREAGGGGGGRPDIAQGGGTDPSKLDAGLAAGRKLIEEKLAG
jgi:alanyl-tRNA synthetase